MNWHGMKSHTVKKIVLTIISPNISFLAGQVECGCVAGHIWGRRRRRSVNSVLFHQILQISCSFLATEVESGCVAGQIWGRRRRRSVNSVPDISDRQPVAPAPPSNRKGILFYRKHLACYLILAQVFYLFLSTIVLPFF